MGRDTTPRNCIGCGRDTQNRSGVCDRCQARGAEPDRDEVERYSRHDEGDEVARREIED